MALRYSLMNYLQKCKTRVTIFLKRELQSQLGYFRLEIARPLPEGITLPSLVGKWRPYHFECNNKEAIYLGSNMFNEVRRSLNPRNGAIASLGKLLVESAKSNATLEQEKKPNPPEKTLEWESLHIQLQPEPIVQRDSHHCDVSAEETLLDLFDQAALG